MNIKLSVYKSHVQNEERSESARIKTLCSVAVAVAVARARTRAHSVEVFLIHLIQIC